MLPTPSALSSFGHAGSACDISGKPTKAVFDVFKSGQLFAYVVTVCSEAESEGCPVFPGVATRLHWPFPDPSKLTGTHEDKMREARAILGQIQRTIEKFCEEQCTVKAP